MTNLWIWSLRRPLVAVCTNYTTDIFKRFDISGAHSSPHRSLQSGLWGTLVPPDGRPRCSWGPSSSGGSSWPSQRKSSSWRPLQLCWHLLSAGTIKKKTRWWINDFRHNFLGNDGKYSYFLVQLVSGLSQQQGDHLLHVIYVTEHRWSGRKRTESAMERHCEFSSGDQRLRD